MKRSIVAIVLIICLLGGLGTGVVKLGRVLEQENAARVESRYQARYEELNRANTAISNELNRAESELFRVKLKLSQTEAELEEARAQMEKMVYTIRLPGVVG